MLFSNQAPAVSHECLMHARHSREMWLSIPPGRRDLSFARGWIARAKLWREHGECELRLNAEFIAANPHLGLTPQPTPPSRSSPRL